MVFWIKGPGLLDIPTLQSRSAPLENLMWLSQPVGYNSMPRPRFLSLHLPR